MIGPWVVGLVPMMIAPNVCDGCGKTEPFHVEGAATCAKGDEINGVSLMATETRNAEPGWYTRHNDRGLPEHWCPACAQAIDEGKATE